MASHIRSLTTPQTSREDWKNVGDIGAGFLERLYHAHQSKLAVDPPPLETRMLEFIAHLVLTSLLLLIVAHFIKGFEIVGWGPALLGALVLGIVNAIVRPVVTFLTFPITILTLGLFLLVINALMLWLMSALVPGIRIQKFGSAFLSALLLSILNVLVGWIID